MTKFPPLIGKKFTNFIVYDNWSTRPSRNQCFHTCCPSVHPHYSKSSKTKVISSEKQCSLLARLGLAEWIIDDTYFFRGIFADAIQPSFTCYQSHIPPPHTWICFQMILFNIDGKLWEYKSTLMQKPTFLIYFTSFFEDVVIFRGSSAYLRFL